MSYYCLPWVLVMLISSVAAEEKEYSWSVSDSLSPMAKTDEPKYVQSRGVHKLYHEQTLERKLKTLLDYNKHMKYDCDLSVTVYRSSVIVVGSVTKDEDIQTVIDVLSYRAPNLVQELFINVSDKVVDSVSRSKDQLLKLKVRAVLLHRGGWVAGQIRVVVNQQYVYLIGPVFRDVDKVIETLESMSKGVIIIGGSK